jgi:hypothetical protein
MNTASQELMLKLLRGKLTIWLFHNCVALLNQDTRSVHGIDNQSAFAVMGVGFVYQIRFHQARTIGVICGIKDQVNVTDL